MARRNAPEVNAGSMADIAFLLLIFFLVTTTIETDSGINRQLPPIPEDDVVPPKRAERNIFMVLINNDDELLVEDERMELSALRAATVQFLDNGGGTGDEACDYCQGEQDSKSSDNPVKAVVSLQHNRQTDYGVYIAVQNELVAAYNELRNREAERIFGRSFVDMELEYNNPDIEDRAKERLKEDIKTIRKMYPLNLSEAEAEKRG